jgi:putative endonuclease
MLVKKPWFVYLIECRDGSVYVGTTTDVALRFKKHAAGKGARYTRMNPPVRLLGAVTVEDRSAALKAESAVRRMSAQAKRAWFLESH